MKRSDKKKFARRLCVPLLVAVVLVMGFVSGAYAQAQVPLPGKNIPKYINTISPAAGSNLGLYDATAGLGYTVSMDEAKANILPSTVVLPVGTYTGTWTWQYSITGTVYPGVGRDTYLGPVVLAKRGVPVTVTYQNNLGLAGSSNVLFYARSVDQTLDWANPLNCNSPNCTFLNYTGPIPAVVHLHGGEVPSAFDGGPDAWWTNTALVGGSKLGPGYSTNIYTYPNGQEASPIWYHDHALGATRLNVYAGLAGGYLVTDPPNAPADLPPPVPIVIQDRMFDTTGQLYFPALGLNPTIHPFWIPEFFGDVIVVNGKAWPKMIVEARRHHFIFLNGSNARFYELSLGRGAPPFWVIGTDGGYLAAPVSIAYPNKLLIAPGERYEVIIDFTGKMGSIFTMTNTAKAPYPKGAAPDPQTVGQIMQFVVGAAVVDASCNPALAAAAVGSCSLRPVTPLRQLVNFVTGIPLVTPNKTRQLTLNEVMGAAGPREILVNNTKLSGYRAPGVPVPGSVLVNVNYATELPQRGSTEIWEIVNLTADAHPMHLHLVQFQLINRQDFNVSAYNKAYGAVFLGGVSPIDGLTYLPGVYIPGYGPPLVYTTTAKLGGNPDAALYLQNKPTAALPHESGWKDTVIMYPGQVSRIAVRWAPTDHPVTGLGAPVPGVEAYPFDSTSGPGYVWHCHIIDHEDNEMMRPYAVTP